ncbi:nickel insertion protein, partial [Halorubrum pallidum]
GTDHEVSVKVASTDDGGVYDVSAEYDDAAAVAEATGLSVRDVLRRAEARVRAAIDG